MRLIDADSIMEQLDKYLRNPEELVAMDIGTFENLIKDSPEIINLKKLQTVFENESQRFENKKLEAEDKNQTIAPAIYAMLAKEATRCWDLITIELLSK